MKRSILILVLLAVLILPGLVAAQPQVEWVTAYDPGLGEFPEGIAVDLQDNVYVSMAALGQVRKISPGGEESVLYQFPAGTMLAGLAVDKQGNVYAGVMAPGVSEVHGVWKIDPDGVGTHLPGTEAIGLPPNGLAFDPRGSLWVTDSLAVGPDEDPELPQGSIWRIPPGGEAELWFQDNETLGGTDDLYGYPPIGANGIAYYHRALYVANTERGHLVRIPVLPHGGPGEPEVLIADQELFLIDGITMNPLGVIFAAIIGQDRIVAYCTRSGILNVLAEGEPLDGPASVTFGVHNDRLDTLYFTNYAVLSDEPQPGILKLELGWPPWSRR